MKEVYLTEGRSTGVPTIQEKLRANGSPRAVFETDENRLAFLVTIPVHEGCENRLSSGISSGITSRAATQIFQIIAENPVITSAGIAQELNLSIRYVEKHIKELKELGLIERVGPKTKGGGWRIVEN